ncbi:HEAT repeat domain-containing protein [Microbacterium sediminicola]|uniref:HEAT repeat domain-containing protein n=1 Tax=Microbacterium sediminicola TaxID=415210 RepID=A0ABP4TW93_9MICO
MSEKDTGTTTSAARLRDALSQESSAGRLQAALTAGSRPDPSYVEVLIDRCAIEPDFSVRDTLTWAIMRHDPDLTVPRLIQDAATGVTQARSQALHTLSKVRDPRGWAAITPEVLADPDDAVARTSWRAAAILAPEAERPALAEALCAQLGRGDRDVHLSLSRALAALGPELAEPPLGAAAASSDEGVRAHALATLRLLEDPEESFEEAIFEARRTVALRDAPIPPGETLPPG